MSDLIDIECFALVVEHGGFSAAASVTERDKTQLSRRIKRLEAELGVPLLTRTTRRIGLTAAGEVFYESAQRMLAAAASAKRSVEGLRASPGGTVRATIPTFIAQTYLPDILPPFMSTYPDIRLRIEASDRPVDLVSERVDIAVRVRQTIEDSSDAIARSLLTLHRVLVASPQLFNLHNTGAEHTRARTAPKSALLDVPQHPSELIYYPAIVLSTDRYRGQHAWTLSEDGCTFNAYQCDARLACGDLKTLVGVVCSGVGIGLIPDVIAAPLIANNQLVEILPNWRTHRQELHVMYTRSAGALPSVRCFLDFLIEHLPEVIATKHLN